MSRDDQPDLDPELADAVREAFVRPVDEVTSRRHLSAMVAAARAGTTPVARRTRPRRAVWRPVLAGAAATLLLPVGLAVAGVSLPKAFEAPYRSVGVTLPHQTRDVPSPAKRPVTPPAPSTVPAPSAAPRPAEKPSRRPAVGSEQRHRSKQQANPGDAAGRQDKPRGPRARKPVRPAPGPKKHSPSERPSTSARPPHKPAASKPPDPKGRGQQRKPPRAGK